MNILIRQTHINNGHISEIKKKYFSKVVFNNSDNYSLLTPWHSKLNIDVFSSMEIYINKTSLLFSEKK
jgi:hypothetical protein